MTLGQIRQLPLTVNVHQDEGSQRELSGVLIIEEARIGSWRVRWLGHRVSVDVSSRDLSRLLHHAEPATWGVP